MKIAVLNESDLLEKRVAITPDVVKRLISKGHEVVVEEGAGESALFSYNDYKSAGAILIKDIPKDVDAYIKVSPPSEKDLEKIENEKILISLLNPYQNSELISKLKDKKITSFALEFVPRISRAQSMDVLSSQANLSGYKSVLDSISHYSSVIPMMMTAAGTIKPAKILILGAGVAGLQAIATAKRLGAIVSAYDVRPVVKEQVESLGAKFIEVSQEESGEGKGGYAKEMSDEYKKKQEEILLNTLKTQDIVITTAQIPGRKAPLLITKEMIKVMKSGSVIFDMAVESGGNVEGSSANEITEINDVKIIAPTHFTSTLAPAASQLFARNVMSFIENLLDENGHVREDDEIVNGSLVCKNGEIVHEMLVKKEVS